MSTAEFHFGMAGSSLVLTPKGLAELSERAYKLDVKARNILFLIKMGSQNLETILEKTIFPQSEVAHKLNSLLEGQFVAARGMHVAAAGGGAVTAGGIRPAAKPQTQVQARVQAQPMPFTGRPRLETGVSVSQARFALSDFCLDCFGAAAQQLTGLVDACGDLQRLQMVLDQITERLHKERPDQLHALMKCVDEINTQYC